MDIAPRDILPIDILAINVIWWMISWNRFSNNSTSVSSWIGNKTDPLFVIDIVLLAQVYGWCILWAETNKNQFLYTCSHTPQKKIPQKCSKWIGRQIPKYFNGFSFLCQSAIPYHSWNLLSYSANSISTECKQIVLL